MHTRHDDAMEKLVRETLRRRFAGQSPADDVWDRIRIRLEGEACNASRRRLTGIWIDPAARVPAVPSIE